MSVLVVNGATGEYFSTRADRVMRETWGHLGANPGTRYRGHVVWAHGTYGDLVVLDAEFGRASDGPWFYEGVNSWVCDQDTEPGRVYRFDGLYRLSNEGAHVFDGEVHELTIDTKEAS